MCIRDSVEEVRQIGVPHVVVVWRVGSDQNITVSTAGGTELVRLSCLPVAQTVERFAQIKQAHSKTAGRDAKWRSFSKVPNHGYGLAVEKITHLRFCILPSA